MWAGGDSLDDLLAGGPLERGQAGEIIAQSAKALAAVHAAEVAHLCLTPRVRTVDARGGVKIIGLGVDAALAGVGADDPARADTEGLGQPLYAALAAAPNRFIPAPPPADSIRCLAWLMTGG